VEAQLGYFVRNVKRMQYGTFRAKGYFIGSGVVEAGCKNSNRWPVQAVGDVLVGIGRRKHPRLALPPCQPQAGRVLEAQAQPASGTKRCAAPSCLNLSHTRRFTSPRFRLPKAPEFLIICHT